MTTAGPNGAVAADQTAPLQQSQQVPVLPATRQLLVSDEAETRRRARRLGLLLMAASAVATLSIIFAVWLGIRWLL
jgi:hypothetical protein